MRIAISGAHGVGKTTLAERLAEKLDLSLITEVAREKAMQYGYGTTEGIKNAGLFSRIAFQLDVFYGQIKAEERKRKFVSDRSVFDCVAYSIYYHLPSTISVYVLEEAVKYSKRYDAVIYCPPVEPPTPDGFRLADEESQQEVDRLIRSLIARAQCKVLWLSSDRDNWINEVLEEVAGYVEERGLRVIR